MSTRHAIAVAIVATSLGAAARSQCALQPIATGAGIPGTDSLVLCSTTWDPDGPGPLGTALVLGGTFHFAGDRAANGVATFDPASAQWQALGDPGALPWELVVLPNGTLVAGGDFPVAGGNNTPLVSWNGTAWVPFNGGINPPGRAGALAIDANGALIAAFGNGGVTSLQLWAAGTWLPLATATSAIPGGIAVLLPLPNGDLAVGGEFDAISGTAAADVALLHNGIWTPLGSGIGIGWVSSLARLGNGDLVAGGHFDTAGGVAANNVARWDGSSWHALGAGTGALLGAGVEVNALLALPNGDLVAGGVFTTAGGAPAARVAQWNGTAWSAMGGGIEFDFGMPSGIVNTLQRLPNGDVVAAGGFYTASGRDARNVARWNGTAWSPLAASGIGQPASATHVAANGDVFLGGSFGEIDGAPVNGIARRTATGWSALGSGLALANGPWPRVAAIATDPNGDMFVAGTFTSAGTVATNGVARWDGSAWHGLGSGLASPPGALPAAYVVRRLANGDMLVAGQFATAGGVTANNIAKWNGTAWSSLGSGLSSSTLVASIYDAVELTNGRIAVCGSFTLGGVDHFSAIALWDGISWRLLGEAWSGSFAALLALPGGDLLAAGNFFGIDGQPFLRIARWDGLGWQPLAAGVGNATQGASVTCLARLPGGDVLAGGSIAVNGTPYGFARWNGAMWTYFGDGMVLDMAVDPRGEVVAVGTFLTVGGVASAYVQSLHAPCVATAVAGGLGCTGSGGPNVLTASSLPWLGTDHQAVATGMPLSGVAIEVFGFGTLATPLASLLPQGAPGCSLLVTPDVLLLDVPANGTLNTSLAIPNVPALVGLVLHEQVVPLDIAVSGAINAVTATNRLTLTIGSF